MKALKAGLRLSLKYSTSDWTIGGANYAVAVVTDSIQHTLMTYTNGRVLKLRVIEKSHHKK